MKNRLSGWRPAKYQVGVAAGISIGLLTVVGYLGVTGSTGPYASTALLPAVATPGSGNCERAESYGELNALASFPVPIPHDDLANESIAQVFYWCASSHLANVDFATGITVAVSISTLKDPAATWENWVAIQDDPKTDSVGAVNGQPAAFVDPAKNPDGTTPGGVVWVRDGLLNQVGGNGKIELTSLVRIAESIR